MTMRSKQWETKGSKLPNSWVSRSRANPARPGRVRKSVKRGPGKRIVEGGSIRLADEVRISSTERPTTTDASSRLVGWSCSRPKPAMHGCSIARQRINIAQAGNFKYVWLELACHEFTSL